MSNNPENISNLNISSFISNSFSDFLSENQITYPHLTNSLMDKFDISSYLEKNKLIFFESIESNPALLDLIPNLSQSTISENKLIKFFATVQNACENQLYVSAKYDKSSKKYIVNKFFENNITFHDDEFNNNSGNEILGDRLRLEVIPVVGINDYFYKNLYSNEILKKKIIVYDYTNTHAKINKNLLIIGIAYEKNDIIFIHSWKIIENYEKNQICQNYKLLKIDNDTNNIKTQREKLKNIFTKILKGDQLASDYLLFFLFSQIFSRVGTKNVGAFPLNLIFDINIDCTNMAKNFQNIFQKICNKFVSIDLCTNELNKTPYYSHYDENLEELIPGKLQLSNGTFLLINELKMNEGKLIDIGIKNINALKNLIDFQLLNYEYPYNNIEINHDLQILILTQNTKSLLSSVFLTLLPVVPNEKNENINYDLNENDYEIIYHTINYIRNDNNFSNQFKISDEISEAIQKNYLQNNKNFNADDFDSVLKLSRLFALSNGRNKLTYEDYEYVAYLEKQRLERIKKYNEMKKK